jgi:hypothetical protein
MTIIIFPDFASWYIATIKKANYEKDEMGNGRRGAGSSRLYHFKNYINMEG